MIVGVSGYIISDLYWTKKNASVRLVRKEQRASAKGAAAKATAKRLRQRGAASAEAGGPRGERGRGRKHAGPCGGGGPGRPAAGPSQDARRGSPSVRHLGRGATLFTL